MSKKSSSIKTINKFFESLFVTNDIDSILSCLDDSVSWTGAILAEEAAGITQVARLLKEKVLPTKANLIVKLISFAERSISKSIMISKIKVDVCSKISNLYYENATITILCKNYSTEPTIISVDISVPFSALRNNRELLQNESSQTKYDEEQLFLDSLNSNYLTYLKLNISKNFVMDIKPVGAKTQLDCHITADDTMLMLAEKNVDAQDIARAKSVFNTSNLLSAYSKNEAEISIKSRIINSENELIWVTTTAKMVTEPKTKDVICFVSVKDTNAEYIMELIRLTVLTAEYEFVAYADLYNNHLTFCNIKKGYAVVPSFSNSFSEKLNSYIDKEVVYEDRLECKKYFNTEYVMGKLRLVNNFAFLYRVADTNGIYITKQMRFVGIDIQKGLAVILGSVVNNDFIASRNDSQLLFDTFVMAEQAGQAREKFLSHISSEISAPIDAILSILNNAEMNLNNHDIIKDSLEKIRLSAEYVQELFTDIIEMSDVSGKKVVLDEKEFGFGVFIRNAINKAHRLCAKNGISFTAVVSKELESNYVGDQSRLGQVLNLVLDNCIKFACDGGNVKMIVSETYRDNHKSVVQFSIIDNGIGIDAKYISSVFEPFVQATTQLNPKTTGMGIGLAICKNLVNLMGGSIKFNIRNDNLTELQFTVEFKHSEQTVLQMNDIAKLNSPYINVFIIDDNKTTLSEYTKTFGELGIVVTEIWDAKTAIAQIKMVGCDDNKDAVVIISENIANKNYINLAKSIHDTFFDNVVIFVLSESRAAMPSYNERHCGIHLIIKKPFNNQQLLFLLENANRTLETRHLIMSISPEKIDFHQNRILIVEEHDINYNIMKSVLERKNARVERAEDGFMAVEMFDGSPLNYYGAIIMDISLPKLGGLISIEKIRASKKADSRTIPIMVMTSSAADEDFSKSLIAGANTHLLKPINPKELITELYSKINFARTM